jgi:hypothetical protein
MVCLDEGVGTNAIMRRTGKSKTCVWRWQERFIEEGFDGLLRDKTRPSRIKPLGVETAVRVVALTLAEPPGETTHWTGGLCCKDDSRWEDGDKLDPISFMRRYRKER